MKKNQKNQILWLVEACQVKHSLGIFETLEQAHNAVCKVCEPDSPVEETKQHMPLHCYEDNNTKSDYYLIWNETDGDCYKDTPLFCISQFKLGETYEYYSQDNNATEDETIAFGIDLIV